MSQTSLQTKSAIAEPLEEKITQLRAQYLQLINTDLPQKARHTQMPVRFNHCFARIVLDNLFESCWYNHLSRKEAAYKQLNQQQLERAIALANTILDDPEKAVQLNRNSLSWRGKLP